MNSTKINRLFEGPLEVINLGLSVFGENLEEKNIPVTRMDWQPPAGGNRKLISLLNKLDPYSDREEIK